MKSCGIYVYVCREEKTKGIKRREMDWKETLGFLLPGECQTICFVIPLHTYSSREMRRKKSPSSFRKLDVVVLLSPCCINNSRFIIIVVCSCYYYYYYCSALCSSEHHCISLCVPEISFLFFSSSFVSIVDIVCLLVFLIFLRLFFLLLLRLVSHACIVISRGGRRRQRLTTIPSVFFFLHPSFPLLLFLGLLLPEISLFVCKTERETKRETIQRV